MNLVIGLLPLALSHYQVLLLAYLRAIFAFIFSGHYKAMLSFVLESLISHSTLLIFKIRQPTTAYRFTYPDFNGTLGIARALINYLL